MKGPSPLHEAWNAVRAVRVPFVGIQISMLLVAAIYAVSPGFRESLVGLAEFRQRGGLLFSIGGMIFAGVLLPELARKLTGLRSEITSGKVLLLYLGYFAFLGALVAGLYELLALWLGNVQDLRSIVIKVLMDMAVFSPFLSMPIATAIFAWRDADFRASGVMAEARSGDLKRRYVRLLVTCWLFWTPVLIAVYAVPLLLQFPLALIAEAAWVLLMLALERREAQRHGVIA